MRIGSESLDLSPYGQYNIHLGSRDGNTLKVGIIVAEFNSKITEALLNGALSGLADCNVSESNIHISKVPGAFELPLASQSMAQSLDLDAIICLGCVIRGDTPHFDYVAGETSRGIMDVALTEELPVVFGVLTTDTEDQATARCQEGSKNNKGYESALSAVEMATLTF